MAEPVAATQSKNLIQSCLAWVRRAHQWLMTDEALGASLDLGASRQIESVLSLPEPDTFSPAVMQPVVTDKGWSVNAIELQELIWDKGWCYPLGKEMMNTMVCAFGLTKEMTVLDLSAGLGGGARMIAETYGSYVTGLEAVAEHAAHGAQFVKRHGVGSHVTLSHYIPAKFQARRLYDGIIARDLFYQVPDKNAWAAQLAGSLKNDTHIAWTDFVIGGKADDAVIEAWLTHEPQGSCPMRLPEIEPLWKKHGVELRISEDLTALYTGSVLEGLMKLTNILQGREIAVGMKPLILQQVEYWAQRMAALSGGLRFYRFYGTKK